VNAPTGPRRGNRHGRRNSQRPRRKTGRWSHVYGALDLGTNNCRLLVAKPDAGSFRVIDSFSRIVRLGEGVSKTGVLSDDAMNRTLGALRICASKMRRRGVTRMRCVATEVCRQANNSVEFLDRVARESGIELDIITTQEEAGLAAEGCSPLLDFKNRHALVFDIGGGSTELVWLRLNADGTTTKLGWMSIPYGVVTLTERHGGVNISDQSYLDMMADIDEYISRFENEFGISEQVAGNRVQMLGTSGTVTTLAGVHFGLRRYNRRRVDGAWLNSSDVIRICKRLASSGYEARVAEPCIGEERADLVVSGCAIVNAMHDRWPVEKLRVADRGVREGLLHGLMTDADREISND
jgi:exopolyphosphatase / guanosine-5'-triphosphate,3'-diphosphate pyrophosphatase